MIKINYFVESNITKKIVDNINMILYTYIGFSINFY